MVIKLWPTSALRKGLGISFKKQGDVTLMLWHAVVVQAKFVIKSKVMPHMHPVACSKWIKQQELHLARSSISVSRAMDVLSGGSKSQT